MPRREEKFDGIYIKQQYQLDLEVSDEQKVIWDDQF